MARIMFIDTECSSLNTEEGFIQELGWAIYDVDSKRLIRTQSFILKWGKPYDVDPGAFQATGLSRDFCEASGTLAKNVFVGFLLDLETVDCVCGHNFIDYDKNMLLSNIKRALFSDCDKLKSLFTFDTMYDPQYPPTQKSMALKYLALDHGYILSDAHQALADVFACAAIFFSYPFIECANVARTPLVTLSGYTEYLDEIGRETFYQAKFRWNKPKKQWERRCRAHHIESIQAALGNRQLFCDDQLVRILTEEENPQLEIPF